MVKISREIRECLLNKDNRPTDTFESFSTGNACLSVDDFDAVLVKWLIQNFEKKEGIAFLVTDSQDLQRLTEAAKKARIELSTVGNGGKTTISLQFTTQTGPIHIEQELTREIFEKLWLSLIDDSVKYETSLYDERCQCNEKKILSGDDSPGSSQDKNIQMALIKYMKKRNLGIRSQPKLLQYPELDPELALDETRFKIFQIKCEKKLSAIAKLVLNSFQNKYIYYAIDDILYLFQFNPTERNNLLAILYAPVLSLHNSSSINFFDIWINQIYINEGSKVNKFLKNDYYNLKTYSYITIKFLYKKGVPVKKVEPLW